MDEKEAIMVLEKLKNKNIYDENTSEGLNLAIQALKRQKEIKEILWTPILFAEKFDCICKIEQIYMKDGEL